MWENIKKNKEIAVFILFLIIGLAIYANSFGNQFFWDDNDEIVNNVYVQQFNVGKMFTENMIAGVGQVTNYYRPILLLTFAVDYQLWGLNSFGFNLVDVLLHILNAWLVFVLLYLLLSRRNNSAIATETHPVREALIFGNPPRLAGLGTPPGEGNIHSLQEGTFWLAFLPALIFLVHPVNTETVDYISDRADLLFSFFLILSLIFWLQFRQSPLNGRLCRGQIINYSAAAVLFILSLLSKETAIILPFLVLLIEFFFNPLISAESPKRETLPWPVMCWQKIKLAAKNTWPLFVILAAYLILHLTVFYFDQTKGAPYGCLGDYCSYGIFQRALTFLLVVLNYFQILFLPFGLHMERAVTEFGSIYSWQIFAAILAILAWAAAAIIFWKKEKGIAFGFFWFFILLGPTSGIFLRVLYPSYEHFLYLPMVGFWLSFFSLINFYTPRPRGAATPLYRGDLVWLKIFFYVMLTACVIFFAFLSIQRNRDWRDPITFYENNLKYSPNSFIEHTNLGIAYADAGRHEEAIAQYEKALAISDIYPQVHYDMANSLVAVKKYAEAEKEYQRTIEMDKQFGPAYKNLYNLYVYLGEKDKAQKILEEANK
jgi:protein O-mannosyl-transferase